MIFVDLLMLSCVNQIVRRTKYIAITYHTSPGPWQVSSTRPWPSWRWLPRQPKGLARWRSWQSAQIQQAGTPSFAWTSGKLTWTERNSTQRTCLPRAYTVLRKKYYLGSYHDYNLTYIVSYQYWMLWFVLIWLSIPMLTLKLLNAVVCMQHPALNDVQLQGTSSSNNAPSLMHLPVQPSKRRDFGPCSIH